MVEDLPEPARRWLRHAIAPGTPLAAATALTMHGTILLGTWRRFTATQVLAPPDGYIWAATACFLGLPVVGYDRMSSGTATMRWRLLDMIPVMNAEGPEIARSAAGRLAAEVVLAPTAFRGATWTAGSLPDTAVGLWHIGGDEQRVEVRVGVDGTVRGVKAAGRTIEADVVLSSADPKTTFLRLIEPPELSPDFAGKIQNYRANGTVAKVNLALSSLPDFGCAPEALTGRIQIGASLDYLERAFDHAKYGEFSAHPWLELTIPSLLDDSLAPAGSHVASVYVHYAPRVLRSADWTSARDSLLDAALRVLEDAVPGIRQQVIAAQVITPHDLEREY